LVALYTWRGRRVAGQGSLDEGRHGTPYLFVLRWLSSKLGVEGDAEIILLRMQIIASSLSGGFLLSLSVDLIVNKDMGISYGLRTILDVNSSHSSVSARLPQLNIVRPPADNSCTSFSLKGNNSNGLLPFSLHSDHPRFRPRICVRFFITLRCPLPSHAQALSAYRPFLLSSSPPFLSA
jgi:hypothetical protein